MKLITIVQYAMWKAEDMATVNYETLKQFELKGSVVSEAYYETEKTMLDCLQEYGYLRKMLHRMSEDEVQTTLEDVLEW